MKHLFYQNFVSLIENRPKNTGYHWRGDAKIEVPQNLKNCPLPLQKVFKDIHCQLLQWNATLLIEVGEDDSIFGEMYLLDANTFDTPIKEISLSILGKNRTGKLYDWVENGVFEEIDYVGVGVYIFVDNADKNFCHLVLENDKFFVPTAFSIDDFLLLLAHTRGLQGLYSCLGRGVEGRFLNDLWTLKEVFENIDIDFCVQKLYEQHLKFNPKRDPKNKTFEQDFISEKTDIRIFVENPYLNETNLQLSLNDKKIVIEINQSYIFSLIRELCDSLIYIEKPHSDDFFDYHFKSWQSYTSLSYKDVIFSISHSEKNLLIIEKIDLVNAENNFSDFCEAVNFYKTILAFANEYAMQQTDILQKKSLAWQCKKLEIMLQFLYVGDF